MFFKIVALKNSANFTGKQLCWSFFLITLKFWGPVTPTEVLPCEICEIFKRKYFEKQLWTTASKPYLRRDSNTGVLVWILWIIQDHLFCRASTTAGSEKPVRGSLLTTWRPLTVLEKDSSTCISLWILWKF